MTYCLSSSLLLGIDQTSNDALEGSINFITPGAGVLVLGRSQVIHIVKNIISLFRVSIRQTEDTVVMSKKGTTKIVTHRVGDFLLGRVI